jgi:formylmethanofuran--tetrahydromethanopterin N-formyltransferase
VQVSTIGVEDTFAEAFGMKATRLLVTAPSAEWARIAGTAATGFATSVIACGVEAGIERDLAPDETPDGRPGVALLFFAVSSKELARQIERRVGQCILTSPGSAVFGGTRGEPIALGKTLRYFGDGFQIAKHIGGRRYWRIPVMDGEFLCEESTGMTKAVGGGNFLVVARSHEAALAACERAIVAMRRVPGVIMPFPGGIVRSGSKVGSKYKALGASTNDAYCPTLRPLTRSALAPDERAVLEIVIDGLTAEDVAAAMRAGIEAVLADGGSADVTRITAGNYGGKLGPFHFHLHEVLGLREAHR